LAEGDAALLRGADRAARALPWVADCADIESLRSGSRLPADPQLRAQIIAQQDELARANLLHSSDKYAAARAQATAIADHPIAQKYPRLRAGALLLRGRVGEHDDRLEEALADVKEAARIGLHERDWRIVQHAWDTAGSVRGTQRKLAEALEWFALSAAAAPTGSSDQHQIARLAQIAQVYTENEKPALAEAPARQALVLAERAVPVDNHLVAQLDNVLATSVRDQGRVAEAIPLFERALGTYREIGEDQSFIAASAHANLGNAHYHLHSYAKAEASMRRSLEILLRIMPDSIFTGFELLNLANVLCKEGRYDEAAAKLDELAPVAARHKEMKDAAAQVPWLRAEIALGKGRPADAIPLLESVLSEKKLDDDHRFEPQYTLARALWALGRDHQRARRLASEARAQALASQPPDPIIAEEIGRWLEQHR
jgi:tetratricopeptide (TPR) repeat protein